MKRLAATTSAIVIATAITGCGGTSATNSLAAQCGHWRASAETFAHNYVSDLPSAVSAQTVERLAATTYRATAASHGVNCP